MYKLKDFQIKFINDFVPSNDVISKLKNESINIYFNDQKSEHWCFDFNIEKVWISAYHIDLIKMEIIFGINVV